MASCEELSLRSARYHCKTSHSAGLSCRSPLEVVTFTSKAGENVQAFERTFDRIIIVQWWPFMTWWTANSITTFSNLSLLFYNRSFFESYNIVLLSLYAPWRIDHFFGYLRIFIKINNHLNQDYLQLIIKPKYALESAHIIFGTSNHIEDQRPRTWKFWILISARSSSEIISSIAARHGETSQPKYPDQIYFPVWSISVCVKFQCWAASHFRLPTSRPGGDSSIAQELFVFTIVSTDHLYQTWVLSTSVQNEWG